jgi:hypothetical protein
MYVVKNIRICIIYPVLLGQSEQEGCGEQGTYNKLKEKETHTERLLASCMLKNLILLASKIWDLHSTF